MGPVIAFAAAFAALTAQSAAPAAPAAISPSGPWVIEYAESMCVLGRDYGTGSDKFTFGVKPAPMDDQIRVAFILRKSARYAQGQAQISFDGQAPTKDVFTSGPTTPPGTYMVAIDTKRSKLQGWETAKAMSVSAGKFRFNLQLADVGKAMAALRTCEKDLLVSWGMDAKLVETLKSVPSHPNGLPSIFTSDDYPYEAISNEEQGTSGVRVWVSTDGKASDCKVIERSGSKSLDEQTCRIILARAKFLPAITNSGGAVAAPSFTRIRWVLPDD